MDEAILETVFEPGTGSSTIAHGCSSASYHGLLWRPNSIGSTDATRPLFLLIKSPANVQEDLQTPVPSTHPLKKLTRFSQNGVYIEPREQIRVHALAHQIFDYPDLDRRQKLEFERTVSPFDLELGELVYLLSPPFPFDDRTRRWLERYVELSEIHQQQGPLPGLDRTMFYWGLYAAHRTERERALKRIG